MKCLKRNFKEDFLEFNKHFYADSKESTKTFYEVKSWATVSEVIKQMQKLSTLSHFQWETDWNGSTTLRRNNQMSVRRVSEEQEKRCFEVKLTAIFNRADLCAYQDYRALTKKK